MAYAVDDVDVAIFRSFINLILSSPVKSISMYLEECMADRVEIFSDAVFRISSCNSVKAGQ